MLPAAFIPHAGMGVCRFRLPFRLMALPARAPPRPRSSCAQAATRRVLDLLMPSLERFATRNRVSVLLRSSEKVGKANAGIALWHGTPPQRACAQGAGAMGLGLQCASLVLGQSRQGCGDLRPATPCQACLRLCLRAGKSREVYWPLERKQRRADSRCMADASSPCGAHSPALFVGETLQHLHSRPHWRTTYDTSGAG